MKIIFRAFCCLALCITFVACAQSTSQSVPTLTAEPTSSPSLSLTPELTVAPTPSITVVVTAEPTLPFPNQMPDFQPTEIPGLFQSALTVETLNPFNGHSLRKITGWVYGFDGVEWMDANHLLLYPVVGNTTGSGGGGGPKLEGTYPAAININSNKVWIPASEKPRMRAQNHGNPYGALLPRWASQLGVMVTAGSNNSVATYSPDGKLIRTYQGKIVGVSPSATKILVNGNTWIDLSSGKIVQFPWPKPGPDPDSLAAFYTNPIWSPDETRVYVCCYLYGDAKTGKGFYIPQDNISVDGGKIDNFVLDAFYGTWANNNAYLLVQYGGVWDGRSNFVPLFDPASKTYRNLNALIGIPYSFENATEPYCSQSYAADGGRYVWMDCTNQDYLMDLTTFRARTYPDFNVSDVNWSNDGDFALVSGDDTNGSSSVRILSASNGDFKASTVTSSVIWHPIEDSFAYLSNDGKLLLLTDARTMASQEATLPTVFRNIVWSPNGEHIALLAKDNSVWQVDYPALQNLEQLTPAMLAITLPKYVAPAFRDMNVQDVVWSSDSTSLAFIGNMDIYIVDTKSNP
jgi:WD40 repeat protein